MFAIFYYGLCVVALVAAFVSGTTIGAILSGLAKSPAALSPFALVFTTISTAMWWAAAFFQTYVPGRTHRETARRRQTTPLFLLFTCLGNLIGFLLTLLNGLDFSNSVAAVIIFLVTVVGGALIIAYAIPADAWDGLCARCGDDLRGNQTGRCPECGDWFSPDSAGAGPNLRAAL